MTDLLDSLSGYLTQDNVAQLSRNLGATPDQTEQAIGAVLPTLLGAMARRANDSSGQDQLARALERDHDGSLLDQLGGYFGQEDDVFASQAGLSTKTTAGGAILDHILGGKKERVSDGVSRASGLSAGQSMQLMMKLAPLLMGMLGRQKREQSLSPGGLGDLLRGESQRVEKASPAGGILARMFDQDGDGDFDFMDVMKFGFSRLFRRS